MISEHYNQTNASAKVRKTLDTTHDVILKFVEIYSVLRGSVDLQRVVCELASDDRTRCAFGTKPLVLAAGDHSAYFVTTESVGFVGPSSRCMRVNIRVICAIVFRLWTCERSSTLELTALAAEAFAHLA